MELINTEYLAESCGDDREMISELLTIFHEQVSTIGAKLKDYESEGQWEQLAKESHKFKASALAMGMTQMADALKKTEMLCKGIAIKTTQVADAELYQKQIDGLPQEMREWVKASLESDLTKKILADLIIFCNLQSEKATKEVERLLANGLSDK